MIYLRGWSISLIHFLRVIFFKKGDIYKRVVISRAYDKHVIHRMVYFERYCKSLNVQNVIVYGIINQSGRKRNQRKL